TCHRWEALSSEPRTGVAAAIPAFGELLQCFVVRRHFDLDRDKLVASLAVFRGEAAALEAQHLARARALRDRQHDGSLGRRHLYLRSENGLLQGDRQVQADVRPFAPEEAMPRDLDRHDGIAAPGRSFLALAAKPDLGAVLEPFGKL